LDICFAALFYRILASNAFFSLKKMTRYLQATPTYFLEPEFSRQDFLLILIVKASKTESLSEKTQILSFFSDPSIKT